MVGLGIGLWFISGIFRHYVIYFSTIPLKQILFYRGFNNNFIHDIIILSLVALFIVIYEYQIETNHKSHKTLLEKEFSYVTELKINHAILSDCYKIIKSLLESSNFDEQIVVLCRTFPHVPNLKKHWIARFQPQSSEPHFLSETPKDIQQNVLAYLSSYEGKNRLKKLLNTHEPAVDPAVIVNQKDLFPDIYHVLISACHIINGDFLYIGLVVEEHLSQTELFKTFLTTVLKTFYSSGKQDPPKDYSDKNNRKSEKNVFFQSFYSIIPGYWIITNPSFSIIITSQDFCRFSGYSTMEINGSDLRTLLIQEGNPITQAEAYKLSEGFLIQKNGSKVPVNVLSSLLTSIGSSAYLFHIADNLTGYMRLKALGDREFRYRSYFNNMSDASFVTDRTTRIIDVNNTACNLFKYNRNELIGLKIENIVSDEDKANIEYNMQTILQNNIARFESTHLTKYGHRILTEVHARRFNECGHDLIHVVLRNIGDRKKQEKDLIHFQKTIQLFAQKGQTIFVSFTEQEQIRFYNQAALELSGQSESELLNSVFHEVFVSPEYQQKAATIFQDLLKNKPDDSRHLLPVIQADGTELFFLWSFTYINREMQYNLFFGTGTDVTFLYKDLERTRHEKEKFEYYLSRSPLSLFIFNKSEFIQNTNTSAEALLGYQYHEFKLLSLKDLVPYEDYIQIKTEIGKTAHLATFNISVNLIDSWKNIIPVTAYITILQDGDIMMFTVKK